MMPGPVLPCSGYAEVASGNFNACLEHDPARSDLATKAPRAQPDGPVAVLIYTQSRNGDVCGIHDARTLMCTSICTYTRTRIYTHTLYRLYR